MISKSALKTNVFDIRVSFTFPEVPACKFKATRSRLLKLVIQEVSLKIWKTK